MKTTKRFIAGFSAMAMAAAMAMSVSATEVKPGTDGKPNPANPNTTVKYDVAAAYIVTIPAGADISGDGVDEQSITATNVILEKGKKINVTLTEASNTASGSSFSAKDESGESTVKYTIKAGDTPVAVGDTVAAFETNGEQALTFTKDADSEPTFAGTHTETLTFGISVKDALNSITLIGTFSNKELVMEFSDGQTWNDMAEKYPDYIDILSNNVCLW